MNDAIWFRLLVRAVGMLLIGLGAPFLLWRIGDVVTYLANGEYEWPWRYLLGAAPSITGYLAQTGFGLYLLAGGGRLVDWCIKRTLNSSGGNRQSGDSRPGKSTQR